MVLIFNIHGIFTFHKRFLKVGKDSLEYYNVLHTLQYDYFKNWTLKGSLGKPKWFFYGITVKTPL